MIQMKSRNIAASTFFTSEEPPENITPAGHIHAAQKRNCCNCVMVIILKHSFSRDIAASASLSKTSTWSVHGPSLQQLIGEYAIHTQVWMFSRA
jgi:hypothetical protein